MPIENGPEMDAAAQAAIEELRSKVALLTPQQKEGFMMLVNWVKVWYMRAGYKRLLRKLREEF